MLSFLLSLFIGFSAHASPPPTVSHVDIEKYAGLWYEIASIPQFFQRQCVSGTRAQYRLLPDGLVEVINRCETSSGETDTAVGRAKILDKETNAKLKVTFLKIGKKWRFITGGDYWVLDLAPDYSYAIVGHPKRKYGWILSRTTSLPAGTLLSLQEKLKELGYDTCDFYITPQEGGFDKKTKLCKI